MTLRLSCCAGHEWETVEKASAISTVCPICGASGTEAVDSLTGEASDDTFASAVDELPPLPESQSDAAAKTAHFAQAETIPGNVDVPALPGYRMLRELGSGGMGIVYLAHQASLNRLVAIKLLRAGLDAEAPEVDRFRAEAEAVASLAHANVVQVFEVGTHQGRPYFTQEYLGGGDLAERIDGTPWPAPRAAELMETLARAVQYAHQRGIVHRDLKPANILFAEKVSGTLSGEKRFLTPVLPKITDFGMAKRLDGRSDRTKTGVVVGTPSYMAPEQAAGMSRDVGPRADVYALGAILYELITGRPPFAAATAAETLHQVVHDDPVPPVRLVPRTPRDIDTICLKCLEKSPTRRYTAAHELAEDLRRFQDGEPIRARPVTAWEKVRKWTRRRPAAAALVGVLTATLVSGIAFGLVYQRDVTHERNLYLAERDAALRLAAAEKKARAISDRHFARAVEAVDQMQKRLGMDAGLESTPQMDALRRQLLEDALAFYLKFLEDEGDDPVLRGKASEVAERTASILQLMGRHAEAEALYVKAMKWQEELVDLHQDEPIYRYLLSQSQETLGDLYQRTGRVNEARKSYQRSLENRKKLLVMAPKDPAYRCLDARIRVCLAQVEPDIGKQEALLKESIAISEPLVESHPSETKFSFVLGTARNTLGKLYLDAGRGDDALGLFDANTKLYRALVAKDPDSNLSQAGLAMGLANLGQAILLASGDLAEAHKAHREALEIRRRLEAEHPQMLHFAVDTVYSYLWLGRLGYLQGDHAACREWCTTVIDQSKEILQRAPGEARIWPLLYDAHAYRFMSAEKAKEFEEGLVDVEAMIALDEESELGPAGQLERLMAARVLYLARLGRHREALEAFAAISESVRAAWDGDAHYGLACAWSQCAAAAERDDSISALEREELIADYVGLSLQMLDKARKADRLNTDEQREKLTTDPELAWLRGRVEFQEFVAQITANSPASSTSTTDL